jgi:hypothetical protein
MNTLVAFALALSARIAISEVLVVGFHEKAGRVQQFMGIFVVASILKGPRLIAPLPFAPF